MLSLRQMNTLDAQAILTNDQENAVLFRVLAPGADNPTEVYGLLFTGDTRDEKADNRRDFRSVATAHIPKALLSDPAIDSQVTVDGESYLIRGKGELGESWVLTLAKSTTQYHARGVRL